MVDLPPQYADDEVLRTQMEARERASREDAEIQGNRRAAAAARLLGLQVPPPPAEAPSVEAPSVEALPVEASPVDDGLEDGVEVITPGKLGPADLVILEDLTSRDDRRPAPPAPERPAPQAEASTATEDETAVDAAVEALAAPDEPLPPPPPVGTPPGVAFPRGGPAAVTTDVHAAAAAAAHRPRPEMPAKPDAPLLELRPTALATEIDRIGDQLVVMTDRIELRDRHGALRRQLALSDIEDVAVERRLTSAVLHIKSRTATDMVVKGLRPDLAEEAQAAVLALLPEVPLINSIEEKALMHSILALHRAGVLNDAEVAAKTALVARMAGHAPPPER